VEEEEEEKTCQRYSNEWSGCASRRIALRNDELVPLPLHGRSLCRREGVAPIPPQTAQSIVVGGRSKSRRRRRRRRRALQG